MTVDDFFARLISALEHSGVPYMITGSYASAAHGIPRATNDIDIVIAPTKKSLVALLREFPDQKYYADELHALDALERKSQFNVIDFTTSWKADFIIRKNREYSEVEFARRRRHSIAGLSVELASAEDVLISKLESAKLGDSERQIEDGAGIIRRQGDFLDREYVERWVRELDLEEQWRKALDRSEATE
ncbi:MAG TPA: hypothetical protein VMT00_05465 [Thermoanaerobaculia bacterium]|nr:hypothetical protein [Thermoanaerobaculia bacterium]